MSGRSSVGSSKSGGSTPTTVIGLPSTGMVRPNTAGSPPSRLRQTGCDTIAIGGAFTRSSARVNSRPAASRVPSVRSRSASMRPHRSRAGCVTFRSQSLRPLDMAPIDSNGEFDAARQSV
jgi:hypothetical protein